MSNIVFAAAPNTQAENLINKKRPEVIVYSSSLCSWCTSTKEILKERQIAFTEINVQGNKQLVDEMERVTGKRTVPQIIINGKHIGGYLSLATANMSGSLDSLLDEQENTD